MQDTGQKRVTAKDGKTERRGSKPAKGKEKSISLADHAYLALRRDIITCVIAPGTEMSEPEIAQRFAMSKTPVREALARLIQERLVEIFPRRGYRVTPVSLKDVNDLFVIRSTLEALAAEMAARRITPAELDQLEALADVQYSPQETLTVEAFIEANNSFHIAVAKASGVPRLADHIGAYLEESARIFYMGAIARDVTPETHDDHKAILSALRAGDGGTARKAMITHCENTRRGMLTSLMLDVNSSLLL